MRLSAKAWLIHCVLKITLSSVLPVGGMPYSVQWLLRIVYSHPGTTCSFHIQPCIPTPRTRVGVSFLSVVHCQMRWDDALSLINSMSLAPFRREIRLGLKGRVEKETGSQFYSRAK